MSRLEIKRRSLGLRIEVAAPALVPYRHGPFTLYEEADCTVGLEVDVLRESVKRGEVEDLERRLEKLVEAHDSAEAARASARWNRHAIPFRKATPKPSSTTRRGVTRGSSRA